ncbi:MAG: cytochrome c biogenesis CcdA family protein [Pseudomonadota bacterium]
MLEYLFAYGAGLLTLINPCVLPVLPIVLASSLQSDRRGPLALAAGMSVSFVALGMVVTAIGPAIGLDQLLLAQIGAGMMIAFGAVLVFPTLGHRFELATAGIAASADGRMQGMDLSGTRGQFVGGLLLGAVWSPCIGPTLGGAIALASQGTNLGHAFMIMVFFALGVSTLILGLGFGAQSAIRARTSRLRGLAERSKSMMGAIFIGVGVMLLLGVHHVVEAWAIETLPYWFQDLSIAL